MAGKTVYVGGAGASYELGLPLGSELKQHIANVLDVKVEHRQIQRIDEAMEQAYRLLAQSNESRDINPYLNAARRISRGMPQAISIDNFIDANNDEHIEVCGKLAIVSCILKAERRSKLFFKDGGTGKINYQLSNETWLNALFQSITENCRDEHLDARFAQIGFVIFNYDRCVEHYLYNGLQNYYGMKPERAKALVLALEIYHPYGTVGRLPWLGDAETVAFGAELRGDEMLKVIPQLRTFTEGTDDSDSDILQIRKLVMEADRAVFLGFAYHRQNVQLLLGQDERPNRTKRVFGTAFGMSIFNSASVADELDARLHAPSKQINRDVTCFKLFDEYSRGLSFG